MGAIRSSVIKGRKKRFRPKWHAAILMMTLPVVLLLATLSVESLDSDSYLNLMQLADSHYCSDKGDKVFIDVGALDGDTLDVLKRLRPDSLSYKCYAWECNRENIKGLKAWVAKHPEMNITVLENAAWIEDTTLKFSSNFANDGQVQSTAKNAYDVKALDLAKWILNTFKKSDFIFLKMDIETAEFEVLPHLFETGAIDYIDELQIEWHDWRQFESKERTEKREELEALLRQNNLIYRFATWDMHKYGDKTDWGAVPKYFSSSEYPKRWVDSHYFREAEGCKSPWDI